MAIGPGLTETSPSRSRRMCNGPTTPLWKRLGRGDEAPKGCGASDLACGQSVSRCTSAMKSALAIDGSASSYRPR